MKLYNDMTLDLSGPAFEEMRNNVHEVQDVLLRNMFDNDIFHGEIRLVIKYDLNIDSAPDWDDPSGERKRAIKVPVISHTVSSVLKQEIKLTGVQSGDYELVFDEDCDCFLIRPVDDGQLSFDLDSPPPSATLLRAQKLLSKKGELSSGMIQNIMGLDALEAGAVLDELERLGQIVEQDGVYVARRV